MLFFESEKAFLKALAFFEDAIGEKVEDINYNGSVGNEWGVNFVNIEVNTLFKKFVSQYYAVVNKYYVKGRKHAKRTNQA